VDRAHNLPCFVPSNRIEKSNLQINAKQMPFQKYPKFSLFCHQYTLIGNNLDIALYYPPTNFETASLLAPQGTNFYKLILVAIRILPMPINEPFTSF